MEIPHWVYDRRSLFKDLLLLYQTFSKLLLKENINITKQEMYNSN